MARRTARPTAADTHASSTARRERVIAGFGEVQRFVSENGRLPRNGADRDIFERLYAVRLDRIRGSEELLAILVPFDSQGLLAVAHPAGQAPPDDEPSRRGERAEPA